MSLREVAGMTELIRIENLKKHFPVRKGILRKVKALSLIHI